MLEAASGLPTATVFKEERLSHHEDAAVSEDQHTRVVPDPRSGLYYPPCGVSNDCDRVRFRNTSVLIAKSHSPFMVDRWSRLEYNDTADIGIGGSVVLGVRNPLDNFWVRHLLRVSRQKKIALFFIP